MDIIHTRYRELFSVQFIHAGFGENRHRLLSENIGLVPDQTTSQLMKNHQLAYKFFSDRMICFIRVDLLNPPATDDVIPYVTLPEDTRLRFLKTVSAEFRAKSSVAEVGAVEVYAFSNRDNAEANMFISQNENLVNDDDLVLRADAEVEVPCFAVIDIYSTGSSDDYNLFIGAPDQQLRSPVFNIEYTSLI